MTAPPAVLPTNDTSPAVKPVTGSLKTTLNRMGELLVGSLCVALLLIVTVGATASNVTLLSPPVEATLGLFAAPNGAPAGTLATTVPLPLMPVTETV